MLGLRPPSRVEYNVCRNLEWQVCAAKGRLPGQGGRTIKFAIPPGRKNGLKHRPLAGCHGWTPTRCRYARNCGYANDDIFYLEICIFNQICTNGDALFHLAAGDAFACEFNAGRFRELQRILLEPRALLRTTTACPTNASDGANLTAAVRTHTHTRPHLTAHRR